MFDKLKQEKESLNQQITELNSQIKELSDEKESYNSQISDLRSTLNNLELSIKESQETIKELNEMISKREEKVVATELRYIDTLTGLEFEEYAKQLLTNNGFSCYKTKASGDGGVDIIGTKEQKTYAIQCKLYSDSVGNKAVQEVYSAKGLNKCDIAIVLTNSHFTKQAIEEARALEVELWDRKELEKLLHVSYDFEIKQIDNKKEEYDSELFKESIDNEHIDSDKDPFLDDAIEYVIEVGSASPSLIQRRFKVGYARAGRIIDQMEERGIISGYAGIQPRKVLISRERWKELKMHK